VSELNDRGEGADTAIGDVPPSAVLDELHVAFGGEEDRPVEAGEVAPPIDVEALVPERTRRSARRSRREAKREARRSGKRTSRLAKRERKAAKKAAKHQPQPDIEVEGGQPEDAEESVRIIATPAARAAVTIEDEGLPDAVYLEGELGSGGSATVTPAAGADARSTVFIDDRGPGTGEVVAIDVATSAARMEPRMRERRRAVKRAAGRKRLKWVAIGVAAVGLVVAGLAVLGSGLFAITSVDVEGAVYSRGSTLDAVVDDLRGSNVLRVDTEAAERRLEAIPWVDDARVTTDFPHGARIEIRERRPMIAYQATDGHFRVLDRNGRVLDVIAGQPVNYLALEVDDGPPLEAGDVAPAGYRAAAILVSTLTPQMRQRATSVSADQNATELSLMLDDEIEVRFGAAEDLQDKLVRLQTALTNPNPELTATELIDVSTEDLILR
jgi:cell division protein FtsQ